MSSRDIAGTHARLDWFVFDSTMTGQIRLISTTSGEVLGRYRGLLLVVHWGY